MMEKVLYESGTWYRARHMTTKCAWKVQKITKKGVPVKKQPLIVKQEFASLEDAKRALPEFGKNVTVFKVGDIVTGKSFSDYNYTTDRAIMLVTEVFDETGRDRNTMRVKILDHENNSHIGASYNVVGSKFLLIRRPRKEKA